MTARRLAILLGCALACSWSSAPQAQPTAQATLPSRIAIASHVREASQRFGIPEHWIYAVIRIESAGRTRAVSSAGAMGLMQLMPGTWTRQRERFGLGKDPFDPRDNILAGTSYLREMYDRYGVRGFLAAYNAGPGRYEEWRDKGRPLPLETRRYVAAIAPMLQSERIVIAAAMQPASVVSSIVPRDKEHMMQADKDAEHGGPANPLARPLASRHDLFAPVSTVDDQ